MYRRRPGSTLFPYTTLFRSAEIVEFGAGSLRKLRLLLDALDAPLRYTPIDISGEHLLDAAAAQRRVERVEQDRKSTRLNSSHTVISYAVFCLKKKTRPLRAAPLRASRTPPRLSDDPPLPPRPPSVVGRGQAWRQLGGPGPARTSIRTCLAQHC